MVPTDEPTVRVHDGVATIALRGDVDIVTAPEIRSQALEVLDSAVRQVRVDLSACTFLDSAGIALVAVLWGRSRDIAARFSLLDPPTNVQVVLSIAGLSGLIEAGTPEGAS